MELSPEELARREQEKQAFLNLLRGLNKHPDFIEFRERAVKPELIKLEIKLHQAEGMSEVELRSTLKTYHLLKAMFEYWFQEAEIEN